jgi:tetratricopeptide (TPR) repeat protein
MKIRVTILLFLIAMVPAHGGPFAETPASPDEKRKGGGATETVSPFGAGVESDREKERYLSQAWRFFDRGKYDLAIKSFKLATSYPPHKLKATLGMGYCYLKLGRKDEALETFQLLVDSGYQLNDTLPSLMGLLLEKKQLLEAKKYLKLSRDEKKNREWRRTIDAGLFRREAESAIEDGNTDHLKTLVKEYMGLTASCEAPYVFFNAGQELLKTWMHGTVRSIYGKLLRHCTKDTVLRYLVLNAMWSIEGPEKTRGRLKRERKRFRSDKEYMKKLDHIEISILRDALSKAPPSSDLAMAMAEEIYAMAPEEDGLLAMLSWTRFNHEEYDKAYEGFFSLLQKHPNNPEYTLGIGYTLLKRDLPEEALERIEPVLGLKDLRPEDRAKLLELKVLSLWRKHAAAPPSSDEALAIVEEIYSLSPGDDAVLSMMSWERFNRKEYDAAYEGFYRLVEKNPSDSGYALGFTYTLMGLGRYDEALRTAERFKDTEEDFDQLMFTIYASKARAAFKRHDYKEAALYYQKVLDEDPENDEALTLRAWSLHNMGAMKEALPFFQEKYEKTRKSEDAANLLSIYERTDRRKARAFALELIHSGNAAIINAVGDYYFRQGRPITAAQVSNRRESCYYNAHTPWGEASVQIREKSGDSGLSKLTETTSTLQAHHPLSKGEKVVVSLRHIQLSSGSAPEDVFAGSYYTGTPQMNDLITSASFVEPEFRYMKEGPTEYTLALGVSPVGGAVSARPTFSLEARGSPWKIEAHQVPVRESILSYSGLEDPYGDSTWGGVKKSGVKGAVSLVPRTDYVLYIEAGYDYYTGEDVMENRAYNGTVVFIRLIPLKAVDFSAGAFMTTFGFEKNTNYYTFGHGGYFSPRSFVALGPTLQFRSKPCGTVWYNVQAALSYMSHETDDTPHYPLGGTGTEDTGQYEGERSSDIGYSLQGEARKLLASKWVVGLSLKINKSSDYTEWLALLSLQHFRKTRTALLAHQ